MNFTESIYREPPYPLSYESEDMLGSYVVELMKELRNIKRQAHEMKAVITIQQKWPATYTQYVNEMTNVNWSKSGAESRFVEKISGYLCRVAFEYVLDEIQRSSRISMDATKFIGAKR